MAFVALVFKGKIRVFVWVILLGLFTGSVHVGLFVMINQIIAGIIKGKAVAGGSFVFAGMFLLTYLGINRVLSRKMINLSQAVIHDLRMRLMRSILKLPYEEMAGKREVLYSAITKDAVSLSQAALSFIYLITSAVTAAGCLLYLGFLSLKVLTLISVVILAGIGIYLWRSKTSEEYLRQARVSEDNLFHHVGEVLAGFREIKVNASKGKGVIEGPLLQSSVENFQYNIKGLFGYVTNSLTGQILFYLALLILLFSGTNWLKMEPYILMNCIIVILYLAGPLESVVVLLPSLGTGNVAAARINGMLNAIETATSTVISTPIRQEFNCLSLKSVNFNYSPTAVSESKFQLGPLDFELKKGEITFVFGGNGSGKTTLFHVVLGLIRSEGQILLNGRHIGRNESIYDLFSPVFSDFHLFDKLYGITPIDREKVMDYLDLFELTDKVTFEGDCFSTLLLSTGQRKRLALIAALLEKRPLLLLDEWAADQDPLFRERFYRVIIPVLKREGFTILAITHDDKYYNAADVLYQMEFGKLIKINKSASVRIMD